MVLYKPFSIINENVYLYEYFPDHRKVEFSSRSTTTLYLWRSPERVSARLGNYEPVLRTCDVYLAFINITDQQNFQISSKNFQTHIKSNNTVSILVFSFKLNHLELSINISYIPYQNLLALILLFH